MKKYIILLLISIFSISSFAQKSYHPKSRGHRFDKEMGMGLVTCGVAFGIMGATTTPDWEYTGASTSQINNNVYYPVKTKSFFQQGPQMMCISTSVVLTITGLITLISSK